MEGAADKLETLFRKAESDLEYMTRKLDDEFGEHLQDEQQLNPGELTHRLQQVKKEYASLVAEAQEIKTLQAEMCESFKSQIQTTCTALEHLHTAAPDAQTTDSHEQQALVESLLKISLPKLSSDDTTSLENADASADAVNNHQAGNGEEYQENCGASDGATSLPQDASPAELRAKSKEFVEVTKEEFISVSSLVRGRVALADVNKVYHALFRHFKEEDNKAMLSVPDMSKMGLRITGTTGEAKLKVLRALKLLQISKTGSVKLL